MEIPPGGRALVRTGVAIALPEGYVGLVHPRSGLAARLGVTVLNAPGTVDAGYRGEILVNLVNHDPVAPGEDLPGRPDRATCRAAGGAGPLPRRRRAAGLRAGRGRPRVDRRARGPAPDRLGAEGRERTDVLARTRTRGAARAATTAAAAVAERPADGVRRPSTGSADAGGRRPSTARTTSAEAPAGVQRLDLGSLQIPAIPSVEVRVQANPEGADPAGGAGQRRQRAAARRVRRARAPRASGTRSATRSASRCSATASPPRRPTGEYGIELRARVRTAGRPDRPALRRHRRAALDGPRASSRARRPPTRSRPAPLVECLHGLVVDRGQEAKPVREPLPLRLPKDADRAGPAAAGRGRAPAPTAPPTERRQAPRPAGPSPRRRPSPRTPLSAVEPPRIPAPAARRGAVTAVTRTLNGASRPAGGVEESDAEGHGDRPEPHVAAAVLQRLTADEDELEAEELQRRAPSPAACRPGSACRGQLVTVTGRLRTVVYTPRTNLPTLEADLYDGSDVVTLVWLGRRHIAGIEPGRQLTARGRIAVRDDRKVIYNPYYELEADQMTSSPHGDRRRKIQPASPDGRGAAASRSPSRWPSSSAAGAGWSSRASRSLVFVSSTSSGELRPGADRLGRRRGG